MAKDDEDSFNKLLKEIEHEAKEAADAYFSDLYQASHGEADGIVRQRKGQLAEKLKLDPHGTFPVSEYSSYADNRWVLLRADGFGDVEVKFESTNVGSRGLHGLQGLKRALSYHVIPMFNPSGTIQSFRSTVVYASGFRYLETYLFKPNFLEATPEHLKVITAGVLNSALDSARDSGVMRAYWLLFFLINLWIFLSNEELIPEEYRIHVELSAVDTMGRRKDIQEVISSTFVGWKPFSEEELRQMLAYAFFWIDKGIPVISEVVEFCSARPDTQKKAYIRNDGRDLEFEEVLGRKVEGIQIVGLNYTARSTNEEDFLGLRSFRGFGGSRSLQSLRRGRTVKTRYFHHYTWRRNFQLAVDRVRNAIFILFCLMTGLRKRELAPLKFDDIRKREDGFWYVSFVRYKTSADANYFGEADEITLPDYLGDAIESYRKLREFDRYMLKGYLFQPIIPTHEMNLSDRMISKLAKNVASEVGVDCLHVHRFRKTIAEIVINKSERNIDLIRMLFGHRSYTMGLRYIARNPFLVSSVVETLKEHFAKDFVDILQSVKSGVYAGVAAKNLAGQIVERPDIFVGKLLKKTILQYVNHMFEGGEAFLVQRTALSTFCMSGLVHEIDELPPCLAGRSNLIYPLRPDASNCQIHCSRNVVLGSAAESIEQNLRFYRSIKSTAARLTHAALFELDRKIDINEKLLAELSNPKPTTAGLISRQV